MTNDEDGVRLPYLSMFHHKHGVSAAVIDEDAAAYWKRVDGHDPASEDEYLTEGDLSPVYVAAPAMLNALYMAEAALDVAQAQVDSDYDRLRLQQWRSSIKEAIAKAEGMHHD